MVDFQLILLCICYLFFAKHLFDIKQLVWHHHIITMHLEVLFNYVYSLRAQCFSGEYQFTDYVNFL